MFLKGERCDRASNDDAADSSSVEHSGVGASLVLFRFFAFSCRLIELSEAGCLCSFPCKF